MNIHHGTTRTVITIPSLGIAIKVAQIHPILFLRRLKNGLKLVKEHESVMATLCYMQRRESVGMDLFLKHLFGGFVSNLMEWWFSIRHGISFVAPTYFSCGLFSIMASVRALKLIPDSDGEYLFSTERALLSEVRKVVSTEMIEDDKHHWMNLCNFGILRGRFVMCDYGSSKTRAILRDHAHQLDTLDLATALRQDP